MRWFLRTLLCVALIIGVGAAGYFSRDRWQQWLHTPTQTELEKTPFPELVAGDAEKKILLSDAAIENLGLKARPALLSTYWQTLSLPGMIVDRPGHCELGVVSPIAGIITRIHKQPGDSVQAGEPLFTLKILSEPLQTTQTELYKATQEALLLDEQFQRLLNSGSVVPESRRIELANQIKRTEIAVKAYRQELRNRGLTLAQIDGVAAGNYVSEIPIPVPAYSTDANHQHHLQFQDLKVNLGQQVPVGQTLAIIADHHELAIEGYVFRDEASHVEKSIQEGWPVEVNFLEAGPSNWPATEQAFRIQYFDSTVDPDSRTLRFRIPLENQSRKHTIDNVSLTIWRFRPGQRVRLALRLNQQSGVLVVPSEAVVEEAGTAYVFVQNVNTFLRKPVKVLSRDRARVVIANDGSLVPGTYVVQSGAGALNRMVKSETSNVPRGYHIHADGSLHKNHDEGR